MQQRTELDRQWQRLVVIACSVIALSYGYFFSGGGWNQASRFDLVRAIVEGGTIRIDRYHENTGDKAERDGHYYCDKAPGVSLLAVPVVAAARPVLKQFGVRPSSSRGLSWLAFLASFVASSLPSVGGALSLMLLARRLGASPFAAALAAVGVGLGTPTFAYSVLFWGHATAGGCLIGALAVGAEALHAETERRVLVLGVVAGLLLGLAVMVEYPAAGAAAIIALALLAWSFHRDGLGRARMLLFGIALGAVGPAVGLMSYQAAAFGSPFTLSYAKVEGFEGMKQGFFGITWPRPTVLFELFFGARRGLLWLAPCLLLAPLGLFWALKRDQQRDVRFLTFTSLLVIAFYFLLNASYHYWDGGFSYGPRHVGPALPFLGLGIAVAAGRQRALGFVATGLVLLSVLLTLAVLAVNPMPPDDVEWSHFRLFLPGLFNGELGQNTAAYFGSKPVPNRSLGEAMGLRGFASLLPLIALWCGALRLALRSPARER